MAVGRKGVADTPRDRPAYPLNEAARYLKLPVATLQSWTLGRRYATRRGAGQFRPLIRPASGRPPLFSFSNLIEAHVLRALRAEYGVPVKALRQAVDFAERKLGIERLLFRPELCSLTNRRIMYPPRRCYPACLGVAAGDMAGE